MEEKTLLTIINEPKNSILRKEFETFDGEFYLREINLNKITDEIVDLENRPEYCPNIFIIQIKKLNEDQGYIFSESICTNNKFLDNFEKFIRENMVNIPSKNFDEVPKEYRHLFDTPYSLVTCDVDKTTVSISYPNGDYKSIAHDKFKGVDFSTPCTLRMLKPEIIYNKLDEIEKRSNFAITIEKINPKIKFEFMCFEYRRGNDYKTVDHFIFRKP